MKHTPGPWRVVINNAYQTSWLIYGPDGNNLAQVANWQNAGFNIDAERNAKLIAAAPLMYSTLKAIYENPKAQPHWIKSVCDGALSVADGA